MAAARRKVLEQLLVEASSNDPRKVSEGSLQLHADGLIDWAERTRLGLVARTGLVDWSTFWGLVDDALAVDQASGSRSGSRRAS